MTELSYFQKYTQRENHITNNTLLMMRHLYQHGVARFEQFLTNLIGEETLQIGLVFEQQKRAAQSVPDGMISQQSFVLYIEAKRGGRLDKGQIERHLQAAKRDRNSYLIGLTKEALTEAEMSDYRQLCKAHGVTFAAISYTDLVAQLKYLVRDFEPELGEIIDDYERFLLAEKMIVSPFRMIAVPCGASGDDSVAHQIYWEPASRPNKEHIPFIGIYRNKCVSHIARIVQAVHPIFEDGGMKLPEGESINEEYADRQESIIEMEEKQRFSVDHRFYILANMQEVNLEKTSPHGLQGSKYFDLKQDFCDRLDEKMSVAEIANAIRGRTFE